jgi:asparagine synthetase B (glutamine-hydrolysing)
LQHQLHDHGALPSRRIRWSRFRAGGLPALDEELRADVRRLWVRNCGRDDRLVADRGREARHPFLDERLMAALLRDVPLARIADLSLPPGEGVVASVEEGLPV